MISRSCISAISTGTAYFHSNRSAMYALITSSEAMIAITAAVGDLSAERRRRSTSRRSLWSPKRLCSVGFDFDELFGAQLRGRDLVAVAADARVRDLLDLDAGDPQRRELFVDLRSSSTGARTPVWIRVPPVKSKLKFRPLPPIASAPISRIVPESEKNHLRVAHEVERPAARLFAGAERFRVRDDAGRAHHAERRLRREHRREQRDERADAEREREALHFGGREREQDERGHERHDVRVDDRGEALFVAGRDPGDRAISRCVSPP